MYLANGPAAESILVTLASSICFSLSGRKHTLRLKLAGCNDEGMGVWWGKTRPKKEYQPQLERFRLDGLNASRDTPVALGVMKDLLALQRTELLEELRKEEAARVLETKLRNTARADRKRVLSRLEQREALHASELAATGLALSADLQAQEAATRGVEQSLRRKEAMIERRDIKLKDAEVELKDRVARHPIFELHTRVVLR